MTDNPNGLSSFWDGDFTLPAEPEAASAGAPVPAIAELGPSGIRIGGRDLAALLEPSYRALTRQLHD
ncbi:hypothetical protein [Kitasatospora sp. McL0602]|uniref:hypothetical protein n=1 Tax=Kitasatospora sp. McL0602 TaxID=3439530 RepID=UPI003F889FF4